MPTKPVILKVENLGHCPSFKNSKLITRNGLITKPEYRKWMDQVVESFAFQLSCESATRGTGTMTGLSALSSIALWMPLDDSRKWIPEICVSTRVVAKGEEGAVVKIEVIE